MPLPSRAARRHTIEFPLDKPAGLADDAQPLTAAALCGP